MIYRKNKLISKKTVGLIRPRSASRFNNIAFSLHFTHVPKRHIITKHQKKDTQHFYSLAQSYPCDNAFYILKEINMICAFDQSLIHFDKCLTQGHKHVVRTPYEEQSAAFSAQSKYIVSNLTQIGQIFGNFHTHIPIGVNYLSHIWVECGYFCQIFLFFCRLDNEQNILIPFEAVIYPRC